MSAAREAGLTARREVRRNLRSTKGIAMFALFLLGGLVPSVIRVLFMRFTDEAGIEIPAERQRLLAEQALSKAYDAATAHYLSACPPTLFFLLRGTLYFLPIFILMIGFDQIAGEIQHRSIRYLAGRARRASIVAGKALGVWAVVATMVLVLHATVWIVMIGHGGTPAIDVLSWGARLWAFAVAGAAAYVGLIALISSLFRTPVVALFVGAAVIFGLWLLNTVLGLFPSTEALTWAFPASYEKYLLSPDPSRVAGAVAALCAWGGACVAGAAAIVRWRDI